MTDHDPCVVFHCASPGLHDLLLGKQFLGSVCTVHGERIGHGEVEHRRASAAVGDALSEIDVLYDCYVIDAEKGDGWRLVANLSRPNVWTIYAPEHYVIFAEKGRIEAGPIHHVVFDDDTGRIEVS